MRTHPHQGVGQKLASNLLAGLGFFFFLPAAVQRLRVSVGQFIALFLLSLLSLLASDFAMVGFQGRLDLSDPPQLLYSLPWLLLAPWIARGASDGPRPPALAGAVALSGLWLVSDTLINLWTGLASALDLAGYAFHATWGILALSLLASIVALIRVFSLDRVRERLRAVLAIGGFFFLPLWFAQENHLWIPEYPPEVQEAAQRQRRLQPAAEEVLYLQNALLEGALAKIKPSRSGVPQLFLLSVAGNGEQDVFRREVDAVQQLFAERYGTAEHRLSLINNPDTVLTQPIASLTALRRALRDIGRKMNRDQDVLFLFLTSHGLADHRFDLTLWPYHFNELSPEVLRTLLDEAGIRYRVLVISACYSGGFIAPLANEDSLVISAARADRNSHGCSHEADWTFFGKAYFDEALRGGAGFEEAFAIAAQRIAEREKAENRIASEPQIAAGGGIRTALGRVSER